VRTKLPSAHFLLHDLRTDLSPAFDRKFDRIVSAYVFHHFVLEEKIRIIKSLVAHHLSSGGRIIIGDIAFQNAEAMNKLKASLGDEWDNEFYWVASESVPALENAGFKVEYVQVSACAGIFLIQK
jgi:putative AdoMet-dependent methyltransferase